MIDIRLTPGEFSALGKLFPARTPLSPMGKNGDRSSQRILNSALVRSDGKVREELQPVLQALAGTESLAVVAYAGSRVAVETAVYYPNVGGPASGTSLSNGGDELRLQSPSAMKDVLLLLAQHLGDSIIPGLSLELELPILDTWVLFALVDLERRRRLEGWLSPHARKAAGHSQDTVIEALKPASGSGQWLAVHLADCLDLVPPARKEVALSLEQLAARNLISIANGAISLGVEVSNFAEAFLLVEGYVRLWASCLQGDGQVVSAEMRALAGRAGSIVAWYQKDSNIELTGYASFEFLKLLHMVCDNPGSMFISSIDSAEPGATPTVAPASAARPLTSPESLS